ncbi:MAG: cobalamin biosynthesis protein CbiD [Thermoplasmatales archaeon]|nr:cobalamin biosynthesis protein CbiD [Thermoplasmatales archaeon]
MKYVYRDSKMLRCGYTTGTCAAAAAMAAAMHAATGAVPDTVSVALPKGGSLDLACSLVDGEGSTFEVVKDGGDDVDATDGMAIRATVTLTDEPRVRISGGRGIGKVTKGGLDRPIGDHAINTVPRLMISESVSAALAKAGHDGGADVTIWAPEGETVAAKTFNERLGIIGGISILGTTGIVDPMSSQALVDTIRAEVSVVASEGADHLLAVPGNYGKGYAEELEGLDPDFAVKFGNFLGPLIDNASEFGFRGLLIVGNFGKLVKAAGGIMDTHSRNSDSRMEIIAAHAAAEGLGREGVSEVLGCVATDAALDVLKDHGVMGATVDRLIGRMHHYLNARAGEGLAVEVSVHSSKHGFLGRSPGALAMAEKIRGISK